MTQDDRDSEPFKLKTIGTTEVCKYFSTSDVEKVEKAGLVIGARVVISGLVNSQEHNGRSGVVVGFMESENNVYRVQLESGGDELHFRPANLSMADAGGRPSSSDAGDWSTATGSPRPTVGDFVRITISKEGLSAGNICEVMNDDHDRRPYKLKTVGTADTCRREHPLLPAPRLPDNRDRVPMSLRVRL